MKKIKVDQNNFALVDDKDYKWLNKFNWHFLSNIEKNFYAIAQINKKRTFMHRLIMNTPKGMVTDHINHNTLDNQRHNLRICSTQQNLQNADKYRKSKSNYKGVYLDKFIKKGKEYCYWKASITLNKQRLDIGRFKNERWAAMAYDIWAKELFGEFAKLNFS